MDLEALYAWLSGNRLSLNVLKSQSMLSPQSISELPLKIKMSS